MNDNAQVAEVGWVVILGGDEHVGISNKLVSARYSSPNAL